MSSSSDSSPAKSVKSDTKSETPPPALPRRSYAEVFFNYKSDRLEPVTASNWFVPTDSEAARLKQDSTESKDDSPAQPTARAYTRRLIPRKYIPADEIDENFNKEEWMKRLYGEDVRIVDEAEIDDEIIPEGWILIDDPNLPPRKIEERRWNPFDDRDPNWRFNIERVESGLPPIDRWGIGFEYIYTGTCPNH